MKPSVRNRGCLRNIVHERSVDYVHFGIAAKIYSMDDAYLKMQRLVGDKIFSVSQFLDFLNSVIAPCRVVVQGEVGEKIGNYPNYAFFSLLDKNGSLLNCFAWKSALDNLGQALEPGMTIQVFGYPQVYKKNGKMSFQVLRIELKGEGALKKQFEFLKKKLTEEGYFAKERKKPIPKFCQNIGLITSSEARGAKKDFLTNLSNFGFSVYFFPVRVEGINAVNDIAGAIKWFNGNEPYLDVLALVRGGGSWESLAPFNSEELVKAIFSSKIPLIAGIGHEDDETLADLTADLRTSTPTHAARVISEPWQRARMQIKDIEANIFISTTSLFKNVAESIYHFQSQLKTGLDFLIRRQGDIVERYKEQILLAKSRWFEGISTKLSYLEKMLSLASPSLKLLQGYSITSTIKGKVIKKAKEVKVGEKVITTFYKGKIKSKVEEVKN